MSIPMDRTAIVMLASGLSRRYGWRDKMLAELGGLPLVEHAARTVAELHPLARVAVCPSDRPHISEILRSRFVIAVNKRPKLGLGHSIAVGVNVALQFKPEALLIVMGDMPFVEARLLEEMLRCLAGGVEIVHAGQPGSLSPPTAFGSACFGALARLDGDNGAKQVIVEGGYRVHAFCAPRPLLVDVDTRQDLILAQRQLEIRERYKSPASRSEI